MLAAYPKNRPTRASSNEVLYQTTMIWNALNMRIGCHRSQETCCGPWLLSQHVHPRLGKHGRPLNIIGVRSSGEFHPLPLLPVSPPPSRSRRPRLRIPAFALLRGWATSSRRNPRSRASPSTILLDGLGCPMHSRSGRKSDCCALVGAGWQKLR